VFYINSACCLSTNTHYLFIDGTIFLSSRLHSFTVILRLAFLIDLCMSAFIFGTTGSVCEALGKVGQLTGDIHGHENPIYLFSRTKFISRIWNSFLRRSRTGLRCDFPLT
jgi:hypothetical protein